MVEIIGAPFDLGGRRLGSRLGPSALRLAGLADALRERGFEVADHGDIPPDEGLPPEGGLRFFEQLRPAIHGVHARVVDALTRRSIPCVLGGEHTMALPGIAAALDSRREDLAVLWIDAHADVNTPASSSTGNMHGMPLAALLGLPSGTEGVVDEQWMALTSIATRPLLPHRLAWLGLRDVDPAERATIQSLDGCLPLTMHDVDRDGIVASVRRFDDWMQASGATRLWISFDVDVLDPILAPGTGTAVRGGLSYREAHLMAELLATRLFSDQAPYRLLGLDVVETNPLTDTNNETAKVAVEWVASLFGKTILG